MGFSRPLIMARLPFTWSSHNSLDDWTRELFKLSKDAGSLLDYIFLVGKFKILGIFEGDVILETLGSNATSCFFDPSFLEPRLEWFPSFLEPRLKIREVFQIRLFSNWKVLDMSFFVDDVIQRVGLGLFGPLHWAGTNLVSFYKKLDKNSHLWSHWLAF